MIKNNNDRLITKKNYSGPSKSSSTVVRSPPRSIRVVQPVAKEDMAASLVAFQVTSDSVVATVRLVFDDDHSRISIHWGDDTIDEINLNKLRRQSRRPGDQQEPNTIELQHRYVAPHDYGRKIILAKTRSADGKDSWNHAVIDIVQRYTFTCYPIILIFNDHLDSYFEKHSEVEVRFAAYQDLERIKFEVCVEDIQTKKTGIGPFPPEEWQLPGTAFAKEISYSDSPIYIHIAIQEFDGPGKHGDALNIIWDFITTPLQQLWWVAENIPFEFDTSGLVNPVLLPLEVHPAKLMNGRYHTRFKIPYEGEIIVAFDLEMKLIVPLKEEFHPVMTST